MFLDASAIIAILGDEDDADLLLSKIEGAQRPLFYSPLSAYEAVVGFARKKAAESGRSIPVPPHIIDQAEELVEGFLTGVGAIELPITQDIRYMAVAASRSFGKVVGHRAKLNLGDCFAYACARSSRVPLLFKGDDFPHTDIEQA